VAVSLDDEDADWAEPADHSQDPQHQLERTERREALERAVRELPEHHRRMLLMREVAGLSYQEIADRLELDLGTVKSRIARARDGLRKILLQDGNFFEADSSKDMKKNKRR
jgi:RNA polymerase sigma-70 factor (ECF subfamily)